MGWNASKWEVYSPAPTKGFFVVADVSNSELTPSRGSPL